MQDLNEILNKLDDKAKLARATYIILDSFKLPKGWHIDYANSGTLSIWAMGEKPTPGWEFNEIVMLVEEVFGATAHRATCAQIPEASMSVKFEGIAEYLYICIEASNSKCKMIEEVIPEEEIQHIRFVPDKECMKQYGYEYKEADNDKG